jgi:hypothetical protein
VLLQDILQHREIKQTERKKSKADEPFTSKYSLAACQCRNANILVCSSCYQQTSMRFFAARHLQGLSLQTLKTEHTNLANAISGCENGFWEWYAICKRTNQRHPHLEIIFEALQEHLANQNHFH